MLRATYSRRMADIGAPELLTVLAVIVLLFGASKLPDLARGTGQALRIFKAATAGLIERGRAGLHTSAVEGSARY